MKPSWSKIEFNYLQSKCSSYDNLVKNSGVKQLITRSDVEFKDMEIAGGKFSNF